MASNGRDRTDVEGGTQYQEHHVQMKTETRKPRLDDVRNSTLSKLAVSFDLENVFSLPRTEASSAFYRRKLHVYNLTAVVNRMKKGYRAVRPENISGRSGNDIASAVSVPLREVLHDHPECEKIILWSDSCVPQNRNSLTSYAVQLLVESTQNLRSITQQFCEPGHISIQDVDNIHSIIGRHLSCLEINSPVSMVHHFKAIRPSG